MCGIVGAIAEREVSQILLEGLKRLEYRGYDSAGIALLNEPLEKVETLKSAGKVDVLVQSAKKKSLRGHVGIAHTRWAHGKPTKINAHPYCRDKQIAVVQNGIKEGVGACNQKLDTGMVHDAQSTAPQRRATAVVERRGSVGNYQAATKNRNTHDRQYVAIWH